MGQVGNKWEEARQLNTQLRRWAGDRKQEATANHHQPLQNNLKTLNAQIIGMTKPKLDETLKTGIHK